MLLALQGCSMAPTYQVPSVDLPAGYPQNRAQREAILDNKPAQWRKWYDGEFVSNYEAPLKWVPNTLTDDQVREVNALTHIENELIDEAVGRMMKRIDERGWGADTDILFSTDHGEFQGDFGLLFKGPYHVDSLMRIPLIWRPAPSAGINPATVNAPVGHVSLASTFCHIAGLPQPGYAEAPRLPVNENEATELGHERVLTEWDSVLFGKIVHLRTICRDNWVCTAALDGTMNKFGFLLLMVMKKDCSIDSPFVNVNLLLIICFPVVGKFTEKGELIGIVRH